MVGYRVGIDIGGTFTDAIAVNEATGERLKAKVLTTPEDQTIGTLQALAELGIPVDQISWIGHGYTVGLNAILTRKGVKTGLLTTQGYRDNLDVGRFYRAWGKDLYNPSWRRPHQERPLVERRHRRGIPERRMYDGTMLVPLDEEAVRREVAFLRDEGITSIAVCLVNSYMDLGNERRIKEIIKEVFPEAYVQTSEIYPVTKEYERTVTVVLDAYTGPLACNYLDRLQGRLSDAGYEGDVLIMQLNGGFRTAEAAREKPINTLMSGPVAGVLGSEYHGQLLDVPNIITFDMGGTSTDVGVVRAGKAVVTNEWEIEHAITLNLPMIEVQSIGAGGGSLIRLDKVGSLRVGPESAGARPGPACYGFGGAEPALTDAYVVMGILHPELFLDGKLRLNSEHAEQALHTVADPLGMDVHELAQGAFDLATSQMAEAVRGITTYRGLDTREFVLLAYGAAGPMHAVDVARSLAIPEVIVPHHSGGFSAFGLVSTDMRVDYAEAHVKIIDYLGPDQLNASFKRLEERAVADLKRQGVDEKSIELSRSYYGMYYGQTWDNRVPAPNGVYDQATIAQLKQDFHNYYQQNFGYNAPELPIVVTTMTVAAFGKIPPVSMPDIKAGDAEPPADAIVTRGDIYLHHRVHKAVPFYDRAKLLAGNQITGPAIVDEHLATIVLGDGDQLTVDRLGNLRIKVATTAQGR